MTFVTSYTFTSDGSPVANAHHQYLAEVCDEQTRTLLSKLPLRDKRSLEVGAGSGSVAGWLATQVGDSGSVLATDINPMPTGQHPRLKVIQHDIVTEDVPAGPWDLIHARLVLQHLPQRHEVLHRLVAALQPNGVLVIEEWDTTWNSSWVLHAPDLAAIDLFRRHQDALERVFERAGAETHWASRVPEAMIEAGLEDVTAQMHTRSWAGGTAGALLIAGLITQVKDKLCDHGMTTDELDRLRELMSNPDMIIRAPIMISVIGHKPHGWPRS